MFNDPVTLSGGDHGGDVVEGEGWAQGEVKQFGQHLYRRDNGQAVFVGAK